MAAVKKQPAKEAAPAEVALPPVANGEQAKVMRVTVLSRKTTPPAAYTEGTLINDMRGAAKFIAEGQLRSRLRGEIEGIGTAATRGEILQELLASELLEKRKGKLYDTPKGRRLVDKLGWSLDDAVARTARLEASLALIAQGSLSKSAFDAEFLSETRAALAGVLAAVPVLKTPSPGDKHAMSEARKNQPTANMLSFAKTIATRQGIPLPKEVAESFDACKEFLDSHASASLKPTEKALAFAKSISERKGIELPGDALADGKKLSAWIDANK